MLSCCCFDFPTEESTQLYRHAPSPYQTFDQTREAEEDYLLLDLNVNNIIAYPTSQQQAEAENDYRNFIEHAFVQNNIPAATRHLQNAINKGHETAIGKYYQSRDQHELAFQYFQKGAERGLGGSQFQLGVYYFLGQGTPANPQQGKYWLQQAQHHNIEEAGPLLRTLSQREAMRKTAKAHRQQQTHIADPHLQPNQLTLLNLDPETQHTLFNQAEQQLIQQGHDPERVNQIDLSEATRLFSLPQEQQEQALDAIFLKDMKMIWN